MQDLHGGPLSQVISTPIQSTAEPLGLTTGIHAAVDFCRRMPLCFASAVCRAAYVEQYTGSGVPPLLACSHVAFSSRSLQASISAHGAQLFAGTHRPHGATAFNTPATPATPTMSARKQLRAVILSAAGLQPTHCLAVNQHRSKFISRVCHRRTPLGLSPGAITVPLPPQLYVH